MNKFSVIIASLICLLPALVRAEPDSSENKSGNSAETVFVPEIAKSENAKTASSDNSVQELNEEAVQIFRNMQSDPDPDELVRNSHYWVSNENAHYVWYPHVRDLGGVISGVGTDQVYLIAGWMNASLIIPMDFDRQITGLHFAYGAAFLSAENIKEFQSFWEINGEEKMRGALNRHFPEMTENVMKIWRIAQPSVRARLGKLVRRYGGKHKNGKAGGVPTFVTDEAQYARIRNLWLNHRVYPICGDLTGSVGMKSIADALEKTGMKMTAVYTSNAGQYFAYSQNFVQNFVQMPFADNGIILRTRQLSALGVAEPGDYHYNIQNAQNFQHWLKSGKVADMPRMLRVRCSTKTEGLSLIQAEPEDAVVSTHDNHKSAQCL